MASRLAAALGGVRGRLGSRRLSVWVFAGEPSGDAIGARALRALRLEAEARNDPVTSVEGVGGPAMLAAGLRASLFPMEDASVRRLASSTQCRHLAADNALLRSSDGHVTTFAHSFLCLCPHPTSIGITGGARPCQSLSAQSLPRKLPVRLRTR